MPSMSEAVRKVKKAGRRGDTEIAHVTPAEKNLLKALGGAGSKNPRTGMSEFFFGGATGPSGGRAISDSFSDVSRDQGDRDTDRQITNFDRGTTDPTRVGIEDDPNARGEATESQERVGQALRLAAGVLIPGGALVSGAARALEFFAGPGSDPSFVPASQAGVQGVADIGFSRDAAEFETRSGAPTVARLLGRSENSARTRVEGADTTNIGSDRVQDAAEQARRQDAGQASQDETILTSLRGLLGGSGFARKRLLGR